MFGPCDNEWHKLDLTIPYPTPQPFEFGRVPHRVVMFCRRPPDPTPPPPDSMGIEHYPTQEPQRVQNFQQASQPRNEQPLFIPEDDCMFPYYDSFLHFQSTHMALDFMQLNQRSRTWTPTKKVPSTLFPFILSWLLTLEPSSFFYPHVRPRINTFP